MDTIHNDNNDLIGQIKLIPSMRIYLPNGLSYEDYIVEPKRFTQANVDIFIRNTLTYYDEL